MSAVFYLWNRKSVFRLNQIIVWNIQTGLKLHCQYKSTHEAFVESDHQQNRETKILWIRIAKNKILRCQDTSPHEAFVGSDLQQNNRTWKQKYFESGKQRIKFWGDCFTVHSYISGILSTLKKRSSCIRDICMTPSTSSHNTGQTLNRLTLKSRRTSTYSSLSKLETSHCCCADSVVTFLK